MLWSFIGLFGLSANFVAPANGQPEDPGKTNAEAPEKPRNRRLEPPPSSLHDTFERSIFITGHLGFGGSLQYDQFQLNYGASIIIRPDAAGSFLDFLGRSNTGLILQLEHQQLTPESRMMSGDLIFRHYFNDRGDEETEVLPFFGVGAGASDVRINTAAGNAESRYWSWLIEMGQEWYFKPNVVFVARFQFRNFDYHQVAATTWSVSGALGIPIPW